MPKTPDKQTLARKAVLKRAGLKSTSARLALLAALEAAHEPLGIAEIMQTLRGKRADQATVYRTLASLTAAGVLRQIDLRHGHADYEMVDAHDHHHLVCTKCGRVEEFTGCGAEAFAARAVKKSKHFRQVVEHSFELYGLCNSCTR